MSVKEICKNVEERSSRWTIENVSELDATQRAVLHGDQRLSNELADTVQSELENEVGIVELRSYLYMLQTFMAVIGAEMHKHFSGAAGASTDPKLSLARQREPSMVEVREMRAAEKMSSVDKKFLKNKEKAMLGSITGCIACITGGIVGESPFASTPAGGTNQPTATPARSKTAKHYPSFTRVMKDSIESHRNPLQMPLCHLSYEAIYFSSFAAGSLGVFPSTFFLYYDVRGNAVGMMGVLIMFAYSYLKLVCRTMDRNTQEEYQIFAKKMRKFYVRGTAACSPVLFFILSVVPVGRYEIIKEERIKPGSRKITYTYHPGQKLQNMMLQVGRFGPNLGSLVDTDGSNAMNSSNAIDGTAGATWHLLSSDAATGAIASGSVSTTTSNPIASGSSSDLADYTTNALTGLTAVTTPGGTSFWVNNLGLIESNEILDASSGYVVGNLVGFEISYEYESQREVVWYIGFMGICVSATLILFVAMQFYMFVIEKKQIMFLKTKKSVLLSPNLQEELKTITNIAQVERKIRRIMLGKPGLWGSTDYVSDRLGASRPGELGLWSAGNSSGMQQMFNSFDLLNFNATYRSRRDILKAVYHTPGKVYEAISENPTFWQFLWSVFICVYAPLWWGVNLLTLIAAISVSQWSAMAGAIFTSTAYALVELIQLTTYDYFFVKIIYGRKAQDSERAEKIKWYLKKRHLASRRNVGHELDPQSKNVNGNGLMVILKTRNGLMARSAIVKRSGKIPLVISSKRSAYLHAIKEKEDMKRLGNLPRDDDHQIRDGETKFVRRSGPDDRDDKNYGTPMVRRSSFEAAATVPGRDSMLAGIFTVGGKKIQCVSKEDMTQSKNLFGAVVSTMGGLGSWVSGFPGNKSTGTKDADSKGDPKLDKFTPGSTSNTKSNHLDPNKLHESGGPPEGLSSSLPSNPGDGALSSSQTSNNPHPSNNGLAASAVSTLQRVGAFQLAPRGFGAKKSKIARSQSAREINACAESKRKKEKLFTDSKKNHSFFEPDYTCELNDDDLYYLRGHCADNSCIPTDDEKEIPEFDLLFVTGDQKRALMVIFMCNHVWCETARLVTAVVQQTMLSTDAVPHDNANSTGLPSIFSETSRLSKNPFTSLPEDEWQSSPEHQACAEMFQKRREHMNNDFSSILFGSYMTTVFLSLFGNVFQRLGYNRVLMGRLLGKIVPRYRWKVAPTLLTKAYDDLRYAGGWTRFPLILGVFFVRGCISGNWKVSNDTDTDGADMWCFNARALACVCWFLVGEDLEDWLVFLLGSPNEAHKEIEYKKMEFSSPNSDINRTNKSFVAARWSAPSSASDRVSGVLPNSSETKQPGS